MDKRRERFMEAAGTMYDELLRWREAHEEASLDEIIEQVTPQRRELMGELVSGLALALGDGSEAKGKQCPECKGEMRHKGQNVRVVLHGEGESRLKRTYYFCPSCKSGFFSPSTRNYIWAQRVGHQQRSVRHCVWGRRSPRMSERQKSLHR